MSNSLDVTYYGLTVVTLAEVGCVLTLSWTLSI